MFYSRFASSMQSYKAMNVILEEDPNQGHGALWLGDYTAASDVPNLKQQGIKTVLCVAAGLNIKYPPGSGVNQKVYNILDIESANIAKLFSDTYDQISEGLTKGSVLVHCAAGVSRSSSTIIAYLMRKNKITFTEAFNLVKKRRPVICPNQGFQRQLRSFERDLKIGQANQTTSTAFKQTLQQDSSNENLQQVDKTDYYRKQKDQLIANQNEFSTFEVSGKKQTLLQSTVSAFKRPEQRNPINQNRSDDKTKSAEKNSLMTLNGLYQHNGLRQSSVNQRRTIPQQTQGYGRQQSSTPKYKPQIVTYNQRNQLQVSKAGQGGPITFQGYQHVGLRKQ